MNLNVFDFFPVLETERLILREMNENDIQPVFDFNSDLETLNFVARVPYTDIEQGREKVMGFIEGFKTKKGIWWGFGLKPSGKLIGYGGIFDISPEDNRAEIGYGLLKPYWGRGYVTEAVKEIVNFAVQRMKIHRLYGYIVPGNTASEKILEKFSFTREGVLKDFSFARGHYFDMAIYARITTQE